VTGVQTCALPIFLVELTHVSTNAQFVTATDVNGFYLFSDLSDGKYLMRTTKAGFIPFNHVLIISGLHKELSGNLISIADMNMFFGAGHQYNAAKGYVGTYARTSRYAGLAGAAFSISPDLKEALGYQKTDYNFDWAATATIVGYAMFYGVTPGNYTVKATAAGYSMSPESFTDVPVKAGEVTQLEFFPTKQ
jgi:hypothetical protein